jgi:hypothetical protein
VVAGHVLPSTDANVGNRLLMATIGSHKLHRLMDHLAERLRACPACLLPSAISSLQARRRATAQTKAPRR